jgi:hypothetical protein
MRFESKSNMDSGMFYGIQKELLKQRLGLML